jgi:hypothetical protein
MPTGKRSLGHRSAVGQADTQNINPYLPGTGWVVTFDSGAIGSSLTELEVYHIAIDGPIGSSLAVLIDGAQWDYVAQGWANGWDPSQPMLLWQSATLALAWNVAATAPPYNRTTNIQPIATLWLRHELVTPGILPGLAVE